MEANEALAVLVSQAPWEEEPRKAQTVMGLRTLEETARGRQRGSRWRDLLGHEAVRRR